MEITSAFLLRRGMEELRNGMMAMKTFEFTQAYDWLNAALASFEELVKKENS